MCPLFSQLNEHLTVLQIAGSEQMLEVIFPEMFIDLEDLQMEDVQTQSQERVEQEYGIPGPSH